MSGGRIVALTLGAWFCFAVALGVAGSFEQASAPVVAVTVWTLTGLVLLMGWKVRPIHDWAMSVDLRWLVLFHVTRFVGLYFLLLCQRGDLSCAFATPAGIGDVVIAGTALLLLALGADGTLRRIRSTRRLQRKLRFTWNAIGLLDIVFVAFMALRVGLIDWESMAPLRELPLSLLPTFLVPLIIASHILIFLRLAARAKTRTA